ncbi:MAG: rhodanese-like domain-containing protein [Thermomicrobiales bacterium]|nr:rhodanese-like domain-containing protein [Thermomicrobiales bacterium]MCO5220799.1 rhodanese-like domain-containing protein [Thermomicrobiales bacterium]
MNPGRSALDPLEVDVATTVAALDDPGIQIVDCREQDEWDAAHVDGMTLMPLDTIGQRLDELDKNKPLIVVCRSGRRSLIAARQLAAIGFTDVKSMNGGLIAWTEQGHPLVF